MAEEQGMTTVQVDFDTRDLLKLIAERELRSMTSQLKFLILERARQHGLVGLPVAEAEDKPLEERAG